MVCSEKKSDRQEESQPGTSSVICACATVRTVDRLRHVLLSTLKSCPCRAPNAGWSRPHFQCIAVLCINSFTFDQTTSLKWFNAHPNEFRMKCVGGASLLMMCRTKDATCNVDASTLCAMWMHPVCIERTLATVHSKIESMPSSVDKPWEYCRWPWIQGLHLLELYVLIISSRHANTNDGACSFGVVLWHWYMSWFDTVINEPLPAEMVYTAIRLVWPAYTAVCVTSRCFQYLLNVWVGHLYFKHEL